MLRIGQLGVAGFNGTTKHFVCPSGIVPEDSNRLWHILIFCQRERLAVIPGFNGSQGVLLTLTKIGKLPEKGSSLRWGQTFPLGRLECLSRSGNGVIDIFWFSFCNFRDDGLVIRVNRCQCTSSLCFDEFVVDEQASISLAGTFASLVGEH